MDYTQLRNVRWFRSNPTLLNIDPSKIDVEAGIIRDVVMVQEGEAKGHGVFLEADFIEKITRYDDKYFGKTGLKARFGHPSASSETMGTQLGIFSHFRLRQTGDKLEEIADLQLLDSAEVSPTHPGMKSWVLKMAQERPDFIMSSIVFRASAYYQYDNRGKKVILDEYFSNYNPQEKVFVEFDDRKGAQHFYTDLVEAGAATENLFSTQANPDFLVSRAHLFLDDNPDILEFVKKHPEKVQGFLQRLGISIPQPQQKKMSKKFSFAKWLSGEKQDAEPDADDMAALKDDLNGVKSEHTKLSEENEALQESVNALSAQVASLEKTEKKLRAELAAKDKEIAALKEEGAADHTTGEIETEKTTTTDSKTPKWEAFKQKWGIE
ncbi:MAG: hypothetical protein JNM22_05640 [Saprospiraceae bacterium]|nr:hypothetical protein [Saprospiraceae bacterium]